MKKFISAVMSFVMLGLVLSFAAKATEGVIAAPFVYAAGVGLVFIKAALVTNTNGFGVFKADVDVQIWADYIIQRLRRDNQFLKFMRDEGSKVLAGRIVHIPQPGAKPVVAKNRTSFPATAIKRTDTDIVYTLDEYTTDPTHIPKADTEVLSYDQINDVLGDHMDTLTEAVGDDMLIKIAALLPGTNIIRTSGAATASLEAGQTGNRKLFTPADLLRAQTMMNKANVPKNDRVAILESNMLSQLTQALDINQTRDFSRGYDAVNGVVGRLYGFDIVERSTVIAAKDALDGSSNLVVNPFGSAVQATDQVGCLLWQKGSVAQAMGEVTLFQDIANPLYYGDIYSALVRMGGRRRRADNAGVIAILQAAAA